MGVAWCLSGVQFGTLHMLALWSWGRRSPAADGPCGRVGFLCGMAGHYEVLAKMAQEYVVAWMAESWCGPRANV